MANNIGTLVVSTIRPQGTTDTFPTVYSNESLGGHHQVETDNDRNNISSSRLSDGMFVTVLNSESNNNEMTTYQLSGSSWIIFLDKVKLSPATISALGGVIIGDNINVESNGTISLDIASATTSGILSNTEWNRINNHINNENIHFTVESLNLSQYSITGHTHFINNIVNLQNELDNRSLTGHTHNGYSTSGHTHISSDITNLNNILSNYSVTGHTHFINNIINLQNELDYRSLTGHTHLISEIPNLQTELYNRSITGHTHYSNTGIFINNNNIIEAYTSSTNGKFDNTTTNPNDNTRLNYNGNLYVNELFSSNNITVKYDGTIYFGNPTAVDTIKIIRNGQDLNIEYYNGITWVLMTKITRS